jgi:excisionase family DNA binding protein
MDAEQSMLTTGQVARLLGCSRQHVVDLCNAGKLESTTIGTHRRIARRDVDRLLARGVRLRREEERSLWLHRALLSHLLRDPDRVMAHARANLERWRGQHREDGMSMHRLRRWEQLLDAGVDGVADVLASRDPESIDLRANSPFAGVAGESKRLDVHRAFARHWAQTHEAA